MDAEGKRRRLIEVDRVTGFTILLVVIGHVVARQPPADNEWYVQLKFYIYQFHMPLFMFMSGLVFQHTYVAMSKLSDYTDWARRKISRLAPGFLLIGTAVTLGKLYSSQFIHVDNERAGDFVHGFTSLLTMPTESAAGSLWYIYVLLEFYLLFPILLFLCRGRKGLILVIVVALHLVHQLVRLPKLFALHNLVEFGLYFWLGAMACAHYDAILDRLKRHGPIFAALFLASFGTTFFLWWRYSQPIVGLASVPAVLWLIGMNRGKVGDFFAFVSQYTFVIYLLNTLAIGVTKGVLLKVMPWDGANFYFFFVALTTVGMAGPILAHRWVFSRSRRLSRIMN